MLPGEYDERVDIWAYGMMLIEMINRDQPFPCVSSEEVQQLVLAKKLPQVLSTFAPFLSILYSV